jgi:hypothetical protein
LVIGQAFFGFYQDSQIRPACPATFTQHAVYFYFLKYSPKVLTMLFSHAKVKALREANRLWEEAASPETSSLSVGREVPGGEVVGGSEGGLDFLMPGGGVASVVDSVEEMFADEERVSSNSKTENQGAVQLVFPCSNQERGDSDQWHWNLCGGLIGGARGNRFCTKIIDKRYSHCSVASHAVHKAELNKGHGYIPSVNDRSNTESAFLEPCVPSARFPDSINDLASQFLSHEEWIAFLTYLP